MPHRPIGSRWRFIDHSNGPLLRGDIALVLSHRGHGDNNISIERTGQRTTRTLLDGVWVLVQEAPQANPLAPAVPPPAAPQGHNVDVAPVREQFTPRPDEMYIAVYRRTPEAARRDWGDAASAIVEGQNRFNMIQNGARNSAGTLEEVRRNLRAGLGTSRDFDGYIIPLRATGTAVPIGTSVGVLINTTLDNSLKTWYTIPVGGEGRTPI